MSTLQLMSTPMHGLQLLLSTLVLNMRWIQLTTGAELQSGPCKVGCMLAGRSDSFSSLWPASCSIVDRVSLIVSICNCFAIVFRFQGDVRGSYLSVLGPE
jgi:hypothetical protein